jgi:hypothetical protein
MTDAITETPPSGYEAATKKEDDNHTGERPPAEVSEERPNGAAPKDLRFWLIIFSLLIATFLSALDLTGMSDPSSFMWNGKVLTHYSAISTALPTIARALNSMQFAWIGNAYSITATAFIPW